MLSVAQYRGTGNKRGRVGRADSPSISKYQAACGHMWMSADAVHGLSQQLNLGGLADLIEVSARRNDFTP